MNQRPYRSTRRRVATERTRARLLKAASAMLASRDGISLDAVAKRAGVTRLTVYNQFGSRRALLEAVFDDMAARGGLHRIREAMASPDPRGALHQVIVIFCDFWSRAPATLWRLHAASASDPELAESLRSRNERRRRLLSVLVDRMSGGDRKAYEALNELVDVLFALTGISFFSELAMGGRKSDAVCRIIQGLAADAVQCALSKSGLQQRA
jgi:AcrR family transcriptional regulator